MENIITMLHKGNYSCVVANRNEVRDFTRRGVIDIFELLKHDANFLDGAFIADKVVGRAAASLMILGGISKLYTDVISAPALMLMRGANIDVEYTNIVPFIKNRDGSGWCPLEMACYNIDDVETIYYVIERFIIDMQKVKNNLIRSCFDLLTKFIESYFYSYFCSENLSLSGINDDFLSENMSKKSLNG